MDRNILIQIPHLPGTRAKPHNPQGCIVVNSFYPDAFDGLLQRGVDLINIRKTLRTVEGHHGIKYQVPVGPVGDIAREGILFEHQRRF